MPTQHLIKTGRKPNTAIVGVAANHSYSSPICEAARESENGNYSKSDSSPDSSSLSTVLSTSGNFWVPLSASEIMGFSRFA